MTPHEQPQIDPSSTIPVPSLGKLIDRMIELRDQRSEISKQDKLLKEEFDALEEQVLFKLREQDTRKGSSLKGTATISEITIPTIDDWTAFETYIYENNALYMLEKRPAGAAFRELIAQGEEVPGLKPFTKYSISLRRT